jgi:hypothetical protein
MGVYGRYRLIDTTIDNTYSQIESFVTAAAGKCIFASLLDPAQNIRLHWWLYP